MNVYRVGFGNRFGEVLAFACGYLMAIAVGFSTGARAQEIDLSELHGQHEKRLREMLADDVADVRLAALAALQRMGAVEFADAIPILDDPATQATAIEILVEIDTFDYATEEFFSGELRAYLHGVFDAGADEGVRRALALLRSVSECETEDAAEFAPRVRALLDTDLLAMDRRLLFAALAAVTPDLAGDGTVFVRALEPENVANREAALHALPRLIRRVRAVMAETSGENREKWVATLAAIEGAVSVLIRAASDSALAPTTAMALCRVAPEVFSDAGAYLPWARREFARTADAGLRALIVAVHLRASQSPNDASFRWAASEFRMLPLGDAMAVVGHTQEMAVAEIFAHFAATEMLPTLLSDADAFAACVANLRACRRWHEVCRIAAADLADLNSLVTRMIACSVIEIRDFGAFLAKVDALDDATRAALIAHLADLVAHRRDIPLRPLVAVWRISDAAVAKLRGDFEAGDDAAKTRLLAVWKLVEFGANQRAIIETAVNAYLPAAPAPAKLAARELLASFRAGSIPAWDDRMRWCRAMVEKLNAGVEPPLEAALLREFFWAPESAWRMLTRSPHPHLRALAANGLAEWWASIHKTPR